VSGALDTTGEVGEADLAAWRRHGASIGAGGAAALRRELAAGSLPAAFAAAAGERSGRTALVVDGERVSHGELDERAARVAGWLRGQSVEPGDRVLLCAPGSVAMVAAYLGVLRAGAVVVLAGAGLARPELAHLAADSGAVLALADGQGAEHLRAVAGDGNQLRAVLPVAAGEGTPLPAPDLDPDAPAVLAYTSGTTGRPKGVGLSHANLLASVRAVMLAGRWDPDDVLVHALPLSHQHGLGGVHATLLAGSTAALAGRFEPERLRHIEIPVLVLTGELSPAWYQGAGKALAGGYGLWHEPQRFSEIARGLAAVAGREREQPEVRVGGAVARVE
jgi:acyl-CoA synthetase (AMP-forming)/AMP-acid ligase II